MEPVTVSNVYMFIAALAGIISLFGYSHANLSKRLDKLAIDMQARKTDADLRILLDDKIQPYKMEVKWLTQQIEVINRQYSDLDKKLDSIQHLLTTLSINYENSRQV